MASCSTGRKEDMQMSSKKKIIAVAITTVALSVGSIGVGQASSKAKVTKSSVTRTSTTGVANPMAQGRGHKAALASILSALVTKGTITQAQADAITAAVTAAEVAQDANRPSKGVGPLQADRAAIEALISKTIGIDTATVKSRLQAGESLGAIAGAKKADLIAVLVAEETKRIDAAVTSGALTAAQATTLKANLVAHVTAQVDSVGGSMMGGKGGPGMGGKGGMKMGGKGGHEGRGGPRMGAAPTIPAPTTSPSTTS